MLCQRLDKTSSWSSYDSFETVWKQNYATPEPCFKYHSQQKVAFLATSMFKPLWRKAYRTTVFLDKLTLSNIVESDKCEDRFSHFFWSEKIWIIREENLNSKTKDIAASFGRYRYKVLKKRGIDFNKVIRLWNQQAVALHNYGRKQSLNPVSVPTISEELNEELKVDHKVVHAVDRSK